MADPPASRISLEYLIGTAAAAVIVFTLWPRTPAVTTDAAAVAHLLDSALTLRHAGNRDLALVAFGEVIGRDPHNQIAHYNLGDLFADAGLLDDAERSYGRALERVDDAPTRIAIGLIALRRERSAEAAVQFARAVELQPDLAVAHLNLGIALARQRQLAAATSEFRRALELNPASADAAHNLGFALRLDGHASDAIPVLERVVAKHPERAITQFELGLAYEAVARRDDARIAFKRVLALEPGHHDARDHLANLAP